MPKITVKHVSGRRFSKLEQMVLRKFFATIGREGGRQKSAAKTLAARENAKRPRPNRRKKVAA